MKLSNHIRNERLGSRLSLLDSLAWYLHSLTAECLLQSLTNILALRFETFNLANTWEKKDINGGPANSWPTVSLTFSLSLHCTDPSPGQWIEHYKASSLGLSLVQHQHPLPAPPPSCDLFISHHEYFFPFINVWMCLLLTHSDYSSTTLTPPEPLSMYSHIYSEKKWTPDQKKKCSGTSAQVPWYPGTNQSIRGDIRERLPRFQRGNVGGEEGVFCRSRKSQDLDMQVEVVELDLWSPVSCQGWPGLSSGNKHRYRSQRVLFYIEFDRLYQIVK
jgi:hypothetical protein